MKKKNLKLWTICLLLFYSLRGAALNCTLTSTMVTVTNATSMANFMAQVNNATTGCPGAVTYVAGTNTYTLSGFVPQLRIIGTVNVDANFTINNCQQILMDDDAHIQVATTCATHLQLYIESSTIKAYSANLWQGISLDNSGSGCSGGGWTGLRIYNSSISDAAKAVEVINGNTDEVDCDILNTTFNKNYISIEADFFNITVKSPIKVKKSRFTCTSTLLAPYTTQYSTAGIVSLMVSNLIVGDATETNTANFNLFDGIACGVFSYFSNVKAYASKFNNIQQLNTTLIPITPVQEYYTGVGIYQRGWYYNWIFGGGDPTAYDQFATSTVDVNSSTATCRFDHCFRGIELHNTHANIANTVMSNMDYGILTQNCNTANVFVSTNTMDPVKWGMTFSLNYNSTVKVNAANTIGMLSPYGVIGPNYYGIKVTDWTSYNGHYQIENNNVTGGCIGIRLENANSTSTVQHNSVIQQNINAGPNTTNVYGIQAVNCNTSNILENSVTGYTGNWTSLYRQTGIIVSNSPGTVVRCNQTQTTGYGIWAQANNTATDKMENNTMNNHFYGLYESKLSSAYGKVGNQGTGTDFNGNLFNGTYTGTFKTFNLTDASQVASTTDKFWYNNTNSAMYTTNFSSSSPVGKPLQNALILGAYSSPAACPVYFGRPAGGGGSSAASIDAGLETAEALAIAEETKAYTEFEEVSKWLDERKLYDALDETNTSEPVLESFYNDKSSESVGKFKAYNNALEELARTTNATDYAQKVTAAKQLNNEVPAIHSFEQNEKDMNDIFLNNLATKGLDKFDAAQTARILALAQSCPFADGKAVYLARALYSLIEPNVIFDDASICETMGAYKKEQVKNILDTRREKYAFISPNPTRNVANLFLNLDEQETGELVLRDLLGNTVLKHSIIADKTFQEINLESVNSGTYLYTVQTANGFKNTGKLVVIK